MRRAARHRSDHMGRALQCLFAFIGNSSPWYLCRARQSSLDAPVRSGMNAKKFQPNRLKINLASAWLTSAAGWGVIGLVALISLAGLAVAGPASSKAGSGGDLTGSWSGGGWVSFASGTKERARRRARYSRAGGNGYQLSATCATASGTASQTATVYQISPNRFRGSFHNAEYSVSGTIRIVVQGNSQSATLAGDSGSASLSLSRR